MRFVEFLCTKRTLKQNSIFVEDHKIAEKRLVVYVQSISFAFLIIALRHEKP